MKIILITLGHIFPRTALKGRKPVVGRLFTVLALTLSPKIVIVIRVISALSALLEPFVLVGGVIYNKVHYNLKTSLVSLVENLFERFKSAVFLGNILVVGYVIAVVRKRRGVYRRKPNCVNAEALYVVELIEYAVEVADTVAVTVLEASAPNLVDSHFLVPTVIHKITSCIYDKYVVCNFNSITRRIRIQSAIVKNEHKIIIV